MDNLIFCLNATIPIFLTLMLGYFLRKINLYDDSFVAQMNKFVFKAALPALLFMNVAESDFIKVWDTKFVLFCFGATFCSIAISIGLSFLLNPRDIQGEFVQASYRSSAAILGIAIIQNLYGDAGMAPLMIIASVPLYNVMAVMVLSFMKPDNQGMNKQMLLKTLKGIASNPIILGILAGLIWSVLRHASSKRSFPVLSITSGKTATPLGLMAMGVPFILEKLFSRLKATIACTFMKLIGFCTIFLPVAVRLGFTHDKLVAILIMLGSATTVSCYIMAKTWGTKGLFPPVSLCSLHYSVLLLSLSGCSFAKV